MLPQRQCHLILESGPTIEHIILTPCHRPIPCMFFSWSAWTPQCREWDSSVCPSSNPWPLGEFGPGPSGYHSPGTRPAISKQHQGLTLKSLLSLFSLCFMVHLHVSIDQPIELEIFIVVSERIDQLLSDLGGSYQGLQSAPVLTFERFHFRYLEQTHVEEEL